MPNIKTTTLIIAGGSNPVGARLLYSEEINQLPVVSLSATLELSISDTSISAKVASSNSSSRTAISPRRGLVLLSADVKQLAEARVDLIERADQGLHAVMTFTFSDGSSQSLDERLVKVTAAELAQREADGIAAARASAQAVRRRALEAMGGQEQIEKITSFSIEFFDLGGSSRRQVYVLPSGARREEYFAKTSDKAPTSIWIIGQAGDMLRVVKDGTKGRVSPSYAVNPLTRFVSVLGPQSMGQCLSTGDADRFGLVTVACGRVVLVFDSRTSLLSSEYFWLNDATDRPFADGVPPAGGLGVSRNDAQGVMWATTYGGWRTADGFQYPAQIGRETLGAQGQPLATRLQSDFATFTPLQRFSVSPVDPGLFEIPTGR